MTLEDWKTAPEPRPGDYYLLDGAVHVVARSFEDHVYAKRLVVERARGRWMYARGAIRRLRDLAPLTRAELAEIGKLYGVCCICGAALSDPESMTRGMAKRCAGLD